MKIVFDLDGVLREINLYLNTKFGIPYPQEWYWKYEGKNIFDWIKQDNYMSLIYAPTTDYYWLARHCFKGEIEIWTCQPEEWKIKTDLWIKQHFDLLKDEPIKSVVRYLSNKEKRELLDQQPDTWLIEDNPLFTHWDRILLVDKPYNKHIKEVERIHNLEDFDAWIWKMLNSEAICKA